MKIYLKYKILLFIALLVVSLIAVILININYKVSEQIHTSIYNNILSTRLIFQEIQKNRAALMFKESKVITEDPRFFAAVAEGSHETTIGPAAKFQRIVQSDLFIVTDRNGFVTARISDPTNFGDNLSFRASVHLAMNGRKSIDVWEIGQKLYQVVTEPIFQKRMAGFFSDIKVLGTLTLGFEINDAFASRLKKTTNSDIVFFDGERVIASTLVLDDVLEFKNFLIKSNIGKEPEKYLNQDLPFEILLRGERYLFLITSMDSSKSVSEKASPIVESNSEDLKGKAANVREFSEDDMFGNEREGNLNREEKFQENNDVAASNKKIYYGITRSLDKELRYLKNIQSSMYYLAPTALFLALLIGYFISKNISDPVLKLVQGTKEISKGNFNYKIDVKTKDEIGDLANSFNEMTRGLLDRDRIRNLMDKVVSKKIADEMLKGKITLGGEYKKVTVLFSDIRGFTSLSEDMDPQMVIEMLNEVMTCMSLQIDKNLGVIDKYVGDEIMALFGAPVFHENDSENAIRAALDMMNELNELNKERASKGKKEISMGIGINTGRVVAGNMGSESRLNYTVLGDNVNIASRLCSSAKKMQILISEPTYVGVKDVVKANFLGSIMVKGKKEPIKIFEVIDIKERN